MFKAVAFFPAVANLAAIENITIIAIPNTTETAVLSRSSPVAEKDAKVRKINPPAIIVAQI